ncbi:MAG: RNA-binding S4 domain-containing protein [Bacilli bacterium]|nr:RNA-binding S4 domain-containing protein [Bacilli bacterium]
MAKREVLIREDEQYITLNVLLQITGLISTGGEAKIYLANNDVFVNGELENRRGRKLYRNDVIKANKDEFIIK